MQILGHREILVPAENSVAETGERAGQPIRDTHGWPGSRAAGNSGETPTAQGEVSREAPTLSELGAAGTPGCLPHCLCSPASPPFCTSSSEP